MWLLKQPFYEEEQKLFNKPDFPDKNKRIKLTKFHYQKYRMTGDYSLKTSIIHKYSYLINS